MSFIIYLKLHVIHYLSNTTCHSSYSNLFFLSIVIKNYNLNNRIPIPLAIFWKCVCHVNYITWIEAGKSRSSRESNLCHCTSRWSLLSISHVVENIFSSSWRKPNSECLCYSPNIPRRQKKNVECHWYTTKTVKKIIKCQLS